MELTDSQIEVLDQAIAAAIRSGRVDLLPAWAGNPECIRVGTWLREALARTGWFDGRRVDQECEWWCREHLFASRDRAVLLREAALHLRRLSNGRIRSPGGL